MDEISLYDRALSSNEVQAIYNAGSAGKCGSSPPTIVNQPAPQTVYAGQSASFSVGAGGAQPLSYQWLLNTNPISPAVNATATNSTLVLTNVQLGQSGGLYSALITNQFGTTNSSNALLTVNPPPSCDPPPTGLVSWWAGEGDAYDTFGANNGTIIGGAAFTNGEVGQAFQFNGSSGYVRVPASASLNVALGQGFTLETWIKPADLTVRHPVLEWNDGAGHLGVHIWVSQGPPWGAGVGCLYASIVDTSQSNHILFSAAGLLVANVYQHIALTYVKSSGLTALYCNGALVAQATFGSIAPQTSYPFYFGFRPSGDGAGLLYSGGMDEISLYDHALSSSQIQAIYSAGISGKCPVPRPAAATAYVTNGFVVAATMTGAGYGYTNVPTVRIIGGGGSGAQAVAVVSNGMVVAVDFFDAGIGYTGTPLIIIDPPVFPNPALGIAPASALVFSNLTPGAAYQLQQAVAGNWSNLLPSFTATNASYAQAISGLWNPASFRLAASPVPAQAYATPQVVDGFVVGATITSGGSGYAAAPAVTIVGGGGTNASAMATVAGGAVTGIIITDAGDGYSSAPTIQIAPPLVVAFSPTLSPMMRLDASNLAPYDNYQIQYVTNLGEDWQNWNGGLFTPTGATSSQFLFITNDSAFFRLLYAP